MQVEWRRAKVLELLSKGDSQSEIAKVLQVDLSIICRDVYFLTQQAKSTIKRYIDERSIRREWSSRTKNDKHRFLKLSGSWLVNAIKIWSGRVVIISKSIHLSALLYREKENIKKRIGSLQLILYISLILQKEFSKRLLHHWILLFRILVHYTLGDLLRL